MAKKNNLLSKFSKALYWHDPVDEGLETDVAIIKRACKEHGLNVGKIRTTDLPPFEGFDFDILFFDWGGMSMGNDMLGSFCRQIIEEAENHPSKVYVMTSKFTGAAMEDALRELKDRPFNIYLSVEKYGQMLKGKLRHN